MNEHHYGWQNICRIMSGFKNRRWDRHKAIEVLSGPHGSRWQYMRNPTRGFLFDPAKSLGVSLAEASQT